MRFPRRLFVLLGLTSLLLSGGIALALHDVNTLDISRPWGGADQTAVSPTPRVEVTYVIKASGNIPADTVDAVEDAITAWNAKIDDREGGNWVFDLVPLAESSSSSSSAAAELILLGHNIKAPPDHGGGGGGGGGDDGDKKADIEIQIKKGGGVIAGSAQSSFDADGFRVHVKIQISSSSFGIGNSDAVVEEIAMHASWVTRSASGTTATRTTSWAGPWALSATALRRATWTGSRRRTTGWWRGQRYRTSTTTASSPANRAGGPAASPNRSARRAPGATGQTSTGSSGRAAQSAKDPS